MLKQLTLGLVHRFGKIGPPDRIVPLSAYPLSMTLLPLLEYLTISARPPDTLSPLLSVNDPLLIAISVLLQASVNAIGMVPTLV